MNIKDIEIIESLGQDFYDSFNKFIISSDLKVFGKLLARFQLFEMVKDVPGDIVECGVFKGTGIFTFLKLKRYYCPNSLKKVIGFDFFDTESLVESLSNQDKDAMSTLFSGREFKHDKTFKETLEYKILKSGFQEHEFELIQGDVSKTASEFVQNKPGAKISLLYMDLDIEKPTYDVLKCLWDRVSSGGIVVFDEYAYHNWSESLGVDKFFKDKDVKINSMNFIAPSAYLIKP
jgi:hypothetical protein